jgi:hypothetical protein
MDVRKEITNVQKEIINVRKEIINVQKEIINVRKEIINVQKEITNVRKEITDVQKEIINVRKEIMDGYAFAFPVHRTFDVLLKLEALATLYCKQVCKSNRDSIIYDNKKAA